LKKRVKIDTKLSLIEDIIKRVIFQVDLFDCKLSTSKIDLDTGSTDFKSSSAGLSPNFIHSIDSELIRRISYYGFNSFISNHDSFSTHPSESDILLFYYNMSLRDLLLDNDIRANHNNFLKKYTKLNLPVHKYITDSQILSNSFSLI
jgi:DNA-directed RNA polymerase